MLSSVQLHFRSIDHRTHTVHALPHIPHNQYHWHPNTQPSQLMGYAIGWNEYSSKEAFQNISSWRASGLIASTSPQYSLVSNNAYILAVMKRHTGPIASPMDMIFPMILASCLAKIHLSLQTDSSLLLVVQICWRDLNVPFI
jgi:hypothetical protein